MSSFRLKIIRSFYYWFSFFLFLFSIKQLSLEKKKKLNFLLHTSESDITLMLLVCEVLWETLIPVVFTASHCTCVVNWWLSFWWIHACSATLDCLCMITALHLKTLLYSYVVSREYHLQYSSVMKWLALKDCNVSRKDCTGFYWNVHFFIWILTGIIPFV